MRHIAVTMLLVSGCAAGLPIEPCRYAYHSNEFINVTDYRYVQDAETFSGVGVARNGWDVDLREIDNRIAELEGCLGAPIRRCGFVVLVAPDAFMHPVYGQYVHPCDAKYVETGLCYGAVQSPTIAVVTPDLSALKHELIHIITHRRHDHEVYARCQ